MPTSAASPTIGITTMSAILTFPRFPLNQPLPETTVVVLEPRPVALFEGRGDENVEDDPVEADEPELCGAGGTELFTVGTVELVASRCEKGEELLEVNPKLLVRPEDDDVELGIEVKGDIAGDVVGDVAGAAVEGAACVVGVVAVEPRRARISKSVTAHATGIPSFQIVSVGLGVTVENI
jgi:hypothetical protein